MEECGRDMAIVVVDGDRINLKLIEHLVATFGRPVAAYRHPEAALAQLAESCPRLLILDYRMPDLNGVEMVRLVRAMPGLADLPVLMMTVAEDRRIRLKAFAAGATDFLSKPIEPMEVRTRVQALLSNQVQIAIYLGFDDRKTVEERGFDFVVTPGDAVHVIRYNMFEDSPLKDIRVRQALNYGTNRKSLVDNLLGGLVKQGAQPARSGTSGYDPSIVPYAFDPDRAKKLLAEAGHPNGFNIVSEVYASEADNRDAFSQVGQDLGRIGVKVEFVEIQLPDMVSKALGRAPYKSAMTNIYYRAGYQMDGMRPVNTLGNSCGQIKFWCDETITPVINATNQEFDERKREALAHQVMKRYHDQAAALFLYEDYNIYAKTKNVQVKPFRAGIDAPWHTVTMSR